MNNIKNINAINDMVTEMAQWIIEQVQDNTNDCSWVVDHDELEEAFAPRVMQILCEQVLEELQQREEVAEIEYGPLSGFDVVLYTDFISGYVEPWEGIEGMDEDIKEITADELKALIDSEDNGKYEPIGQFYVVGELHGKPCWTGCDNQRGDAWVEDFDSFENCIAWLMGHDIDNGVIV